MFRFTTRNQHKEVRDKLNQYNDKLDAINNILCKDTKSIKEFTLGIDELNTRIDKLEDQLRNNIVEFHEYKESTPHLLKSEIDKIENKIELIKKLILAYFSSEGFSNLLKIVDELRNTK